jgi:predicted AAA+ superfamily ATPase
MTRDMFDMERVPPELDGFLRSVNPWWEGRPGPVTPSYRRWAFHVIQAKLRGGLAPAVVVRGPRQVGKTTLQQQLIEDLLQSGEVRPRSILRVQFDEIPSLRGMREPILSISRWFENRILGHSFNEEAGSGRITHLFFDEVQNLKDWAPQVKALVDNNTVKVLITGSSALRMEAGRDSLAGRITQVHLGTLLLREVAGLRFGETIAGQLPENGLEPLLRKGLWEQLQSDGTANQVSRDRAFAAFAERGGYPMAQAHPGVPWPEVADQLNETVIKRAIQHDLRMGERGRRRDPQLLEEVFRLACRYAGQSPGQAVLMAEVKQALNANI